ncbi:TPA: hypothetical protein SMP26_001857 [Proteus mirabilis]|nr:hypothetical protein [Proteus mirabilis]
MNNTKFTINVHNNENTTENAIPSAYNCGRQIKSNNIIYTGSDLTDLRKSTTYRSKEYRLIEKFIKEVKEENYIRDGETLAGCVLVRDNDEIYVSVLISCGYEMRGVMRHVSRHKGNAYVKDGKTVTGTVFSNWVIPVCSDKGLMFPITFFESALNNVPSTKTIETPNAEEKTVETVSVNDDLLREIEELKMKLSLMEEKTQRLENKVEELEEVIRQKDMVIETQSISVTEMSDEEKLELAKSNITVSSFDEFEEKEDAVVVSNGIPEEIKEILIGQPDVNIWNSYVCHKFTLAPITMQDIFNIRSTDMDARLVLKNVA